MDHEKVGALAHRCHRALEPLHAVIYFAPEAEQRYTSAGLRPGRMGYFASRSAPMGAVGPGVVGATFYNFSPELIARHIPRAWTLAGPEKVVAARFGAADAALRRLLGDAVSAPEVAEAATLAREATEGCTIEGRPLYAGHAELDWPSEPHLVLWHAITLLREFRGDGHVAVLAANGLGGLPALVTHVATGKGFLPAMAKASRGWSDQQWADATAELTAAGLLDDRETLTEAGAGLRRRIEEQTNAADTGPWLALGADKAARLAELGRSLSRTVVAAGAFPPNVFAKGAPNT
ncbi:MAG TPA: hypothetical protein VJT49_01420 [Amycolatopsis sp.]|uniref:SCO6745 family protein n=1 Tax=Amycolatopsis sp. TaxID=37632 RepID=UPI002B498C7C|nr:hypothetical protein [Amycolatopsis sp.]HKS43772.1 hypothetical protein [Amycolatopsis sp.]